LWRAKRIERSLVGDVELIDDYELSVMHLAPWNEKLALQEGAMHVCGEGCAQKLQSQFMGNVLENRVRRSSG
jgi:hypothetical protein